MGSEKIEQQQHEGEHYLRLLGLEHLADQEVSTSRGTMQARDFLEICGEHARPILIGFESMNPSDPRYEPTKNALRSFIGKYIEGDKPAE